MSSNPPETETETGSTGDALPPDEPLLPPVEPPNARFLIQLFVVPAVIVMFVVGIWWLVTAMATSSANDPAAVVAKLRSSNQNRWQEAYELANMLRVEQRYPKLKRNEKLAGELAALLAEEIESESVDENPVKLRMFLCSALGAFKISEGLDELLEAARDDVDPGVRRAAIDAIAVRAQTALERDPAEALEHPELVQTFTELANQPDELIRSQTAYALGVLTQHEKAEQQLTVELENLVDDLHTDTRYNAALALARQGSPKAIGAIREMLDPEAIKLSVSREESPGRQTHKRNTIIRNALESARTIHKVNPQQDLSVLNDAIEEFISSAPSWENYDRSLKALVDLAGEVQKDLQQ